MTCGRELFRNYPAIVQFGNFNEGWGQSNIKPYNATDPGSMSWQDFTAKMHHLTRTLVGDSMLVADATGGKCACPQSQCASKQNPGPLIPSFANRALIHGAGCYGDIQDQHGGRPGCLLKPNTSVVNTSRCRLFARPAPTFPGTASPAGPRRTGSTVGRASPPSSGKSSARRGGVAAVASSMRARARSTPPIT